MHLKIFLSIALALALNVSVCSVAAAQQFLLLPVDSDGPMSYGSIGYLSCLSNDRTENDTSAVSTGSCNDAEACLSQSPSFVDAADTSSASVEIHPAMENQYAYAYVSDDTFVPTARDGPLFPQSTMLAHSLIKLE